MPFDRSLLAPIAGGFDRSQLVPIQESSPTNPQLDVSLAQVPATPEEREFQNIEGVKRIRELAPGYNPGAVEQQKGLWEMATSPLAHLVTPKELADAVDTIKATFGYDPESVESAELVQEELAQPSRPPSTPEQIIAGVQNVAAETTTSPIALAMPAAGALPSGAQKALMYGFTAQQLAHLPQAIKQAKEAKTPYERTKAYLGLAADIVLPAAVAGHEGMRGYRAIQNRGAQIRAAEPIVEAPVVLESLPVEAAAKPLAERAPETPQPEAVTAKEPWQMTQEEYRRYGNQPDKRNAYHKEQVELAIARQKTVPPEVLADYPDLQTEIKPKGIAASAREKLAEGGEAGFINLKPAIEAVERKRQAIISLGKSVENRNIMDQTFDAADNMATVAGQQARTKLDIGTTPIEREAAMAIVEANGDPLKLNQFLSQARAGDNTKAQAAVRYAQANWAALQPLAQRTKALLDDQITAENAAGINTEYHTAYIPHIYEMDLLMGGGRPYVIAGKSGTGGSGFKKGRTFDTVFDAIQAGYTPKSMDVGQLVEHRIKAGQRLINRKAWANSLRSVVDPSNGEPIVTDMVTTPRGAGMAPSVTPPLGYRPFEIIPGVRVAVHEGYAPLFDALTGTSKVAGNVPGQIALQTAGAIKHGLLAFDTFHAGRITMRELFLTKKASYKKGQTLLEYSDADLTRAVNEGLITPEMQTWVQNNRATADLLLKNGLNVGRVQEALYNGVVRKIPVIGTFNKWVFEKLTRGAMMESALIEFDRVSKALPSLTPGQIARKVSRDLNVYFGNLGSQGVFKSKTFQDMARLVALAPNWVESMARTEIKGAFQAAKGLTYDPIVHRAIMTGSVGKGVAQGVLAMFAAAQILNLVTRKKFTWENEEEGHKLDAWIPDVTGKSPGFFISPFSVQAEITHDFLRYNESEPSQSKLAVAARIAMNKASPLFRAGKVLATGTDWDKKKLTSDWDRAKAAAIALAPTPIPLSTLTKANAPPGALQRQLTASVGLKTEPAPTASQQLFHLQQEWQRDNPDPKIRHKFEQRLKETFPESDYKPMRDALRSGDLDKARTEYEKLITELKKKRGDVIEAMMPNRPLMSRREDALFQRSLSPQQREIFNKARQERVEQWKRFQQMLRSAKRS